MQSNCHISNFRGTDLVPPNLNWLQIVVSFLLELHRLKIYILADLTLLIQNKRQRFS